jgi:hypothetical protein
VSDHPDVYTDGFGIAGGPFGLTFTFTLSQPTGAPGPHEDPTLPVVRLRMSRDLARTLVDMLTQALAAPLPNPQASSNVKN